MLFFALKLSIILSLMMRMLGKKWGVGREGVIQPIFLAQSDVGYHDLRAQIQKF